MILLPHALHLVPYFQPGLVVLVVCCQQIAIVKVCFAFGYNLVCKSHTERVYIYSNEH